MEKILITGTAGFVGFHLVNKFINQGYHITGLDNINDYYDTALKYGRLKETGIDEAEIEYNKVLASTKYSNYQFIKLDLADRENVSALFEKERFDYVINLAAQAGVRYSIVNPYAYIESNVSGFLNILEGCRHNPVKHLIYASSSSVYGENETIPFSEDHAVDNPISLYAATKKSNELFAHTYSHLYNIPATGLRFFTVYGAWGRPDMAYFSFTDAVLKGKTIKVFNNGIMKRDFTYIDDITESISRLLLKAPISTKKSETKTKAPCRVFNIGNNTPVELMQFINTIESAAGKEAIKEFLPMQPGDVPLTYADTSKLEAVIGPISKVNIEIGIPRFTEWFINYYGK